MSFIRTDNRATNVTDFTQGDPLSHIMSFYWPLLFTSMLQQIYNFVDMMIVGNGIGDDAFAAVGNMGSLFFLIIGFSLGLANGFGILIAQSFGARKNDELKHRLGATIKLSVVMSVLLTATSILFLPYALKIINTDDALMYDCLKYGYIIFGGLSASVCFNVCAAVLKSLGDSKTPFRAILTSSVINLILDCLFIFVLHTGVEGAAAATVISQVVSSVVCLKRLRTMEIIRLRPEDYRNERSVYWELIMNGMPMAFMNSITAIGCMVVQFFINKNGVEYTTAYSACAKYLNIFMNPASTAGNAMSAYTSQNYGAAKYRRISDGLRVCLSISFITYLLLGSLMVFFPEPLAKILISGQTAVDLACEYLPICGVTIIAVDCLFVVRSAVQGMGRPIIPMWSGVLEMVLRVAVISLFMDMIGFKAAAFAEVSAWTGALLLNVIAYRCILTPKLTGIRNVQEDMKYSVSEEPLRSAALSPHPYLRRGSGMS